MRSPIPVITLVLLCVGGTATPLAASEAATCCYSNPRFSGQCEVTLGADEKCSDVLTYLNTQNSVGKNYCGNTTIRGGWTPVTCEESEAADRLVSGVPDGICDRHTALQQSGNGGNR